MRNGLDMEKLTLPQILANSMLGYFSFIFYFKKDVLT